MRTITALLQQRIDTANNWTANNTVLLAGEIGIEADTRRFKIGDGLTPWASLAYSTAVLELSTAAPLALGIANPGISTKAARADHRHPLPTLQDLNAEQTGTAAALMQVHLDSPDPHQQYIRKEEADDLFATRAQGLLAETAVQPEDLALVATSGSYNDLLNKPFIPALSTLAGFSLSTTGSAGVSNVAAREDHKHPLPSALDLNVDPAGTAASLLAAHVAAPDPHPQYLTSAEAAAAAPVQSVAGKTGHVTLVAADVTGVELLGTAASTMQAHLAAQDPHPQYLTVAELAAFAPVKTVAGRTGNIILNINDISGGEIAGTAANLMAAHLAAANPHPQYVTSVNTKVGAVVLIATDVGADPAGTALTLVTNHANAADPHAQYTTAPELTAAITSAVNAHLAAEDPHAQYATDTAVATAISAAVSAHTAAADPHPQYVTPAEIPVVSVAGKTGAVVLDVQDVANAVPTSAIGTANGIAPLDNETKVPEQYLRPAVVPWWRFFVV